MAPPDQGLANRGVEMLRLSIMFVPWRARWRQSSGRRRLELMIVQPGMAATSRWVGATCLQVSIRLHWSPANEMAGSRLPTDRTIHTRSEPSIRSNARTHADPHYQTSSLQPPHSDPDPLLSSPARPPPPSHVLTGAPDPVLHEPGLRHRSYRSSPRAATRRQGRRALSSGELAATPTDKEATGCGPAAPANHGPSSR